MSELKTKGYSTAGALDTWCIDKESSISLLRSALKLYNLTSNKEYLDDAIAVSYYLSTWLWHYNGVYPENDNFTQYNYKTFGATSVSVQHHHLDPYALFWVPEWFELTKLTGDSQWKEKAIAIWNNGCQLIISTHSPILMAYPNADIYAIDDTGAHITPYEETEHYQLTKYFLTYTEQMMKELLG